ncbi:MAG TPA: hypothetical protein VH257_14150 [Chloroflexota bacterium]|nr:hypothetical protein [Chloroflexota bacterium]
MIEKVLLATSYVLCYALWLVTVALGLLDLFALRQLVEWAYVALGLDKWGLVATSHIATILFALVWLGLIVYAEQDYRVGVARRDLFRRFAKLTVIQAVPLAVALAVVAPRWSGP